MAEQTSKRFTSDEDGRLHVRQLVRERQAGPRTKRIVTKAKKGRFKVRTVQAEPLALKLKSAPTLRKAQ